MVLLYYIVSLHQTTTGASDAELDALLYYIVSLHQTTTKPLRLKSRPYVVLYRFSTSNHNFLQGSPYYHLVVLYRFSTSNHNWKWTPKCCPRLYYIVSLHQTTTILKFYVLRKSCIISFLYIKPQLAPTNFIVFIVVLYRFSTSNHNSICTTLRFGWVVLYRFSTSNHNLRQLWNMIQKLYYIVSLHQTTTYRLFLFLVNLLYYIVSLHQTTTFRLSRMISRLLYYIVSLHQTTTLTWCLPTARKLYYIVSLHQTTTSSTIQQTLLRLYYIVSLHQTTTIAVVSKTIVWLYYIVSLHQTTTHNSHDIF